MVKTLQDKVAILTHEKSSLQDEKEGLRTEKQMIEQKQTVDQATCSQAVLIKKGELDDIKKERDLLAKKLDKKRDKCARMKKELETRVKTVEDEKKDIATAKDNQMKSMMQTLLTMK